jgi:hypothetical protein
VRRLALGRPSLRDDPSAGIARGDQQNLGPEIASAPIRQGRVLTRLAGVFFVARDMMGATRPITLRSVRHRRWQPGRQDGTSSCRYRCR